MVLSALGDITERPRPLAKADCPDPMPAPDELLVRVATCGVCHTELDEIEGRTPPSALPRILGHQIAGRVAECGRDVRDFSPGDRVGIAWIHWTCGRCRWCQAGEENLCPEFRATGRDVDGGYAELTTVPAAFAHRIPNQLSDDDAAPMLCAGAIGYRSLRLAGLHDGDVLGLTGFGASGHLVLRLARHLFPKSDVFVFARSEREREFARAMGAAWTGDTADSPPQPVTSIIDTTPAWTPVIEALHHLNRGGRLVINAIRKENSDRDALNRLDYPEHLWLEKEIKSVANVTRRDVREFLYLAARFELKPTIEVYPLEDANQALLDLKTRHVHGAKVLKIQ